MRIENQTKYRIDSVNREERKSPNLDDAVDEEI